MDAALIATRKGLFLLEGDALRCVGFLGDPVTMALHDPRDGALYAAVGHGHFGAKLHRSLDRGASWQEISAPVYPEKPAGVVDRDPARNRERDWSLNLIWSLEPGGADEPGVLWCGTIPGGLFRSSDKGASWQLIESLWNHPARAKWFGGGYDDPGIHSIAIDPRDSRRITIGVSCGGVWVSEDGGASWGLRAKGMWAAYMPPEQQNEEAVQDPHRLALCKAMPDQIWVQHHNGAFVSSDGAASWRELNVPPSSFGFAVAAHPRDPKTAWFVPAVKDEQRIPVNGELVVARTRDGGASFEVLNNGLPKPPAYDLIYRHALDVSADGACLLFGSTTGNLWLSHDEGDSFRAVAHHLPPIYATRFA
jgi:hypothetical protein